MTKNKTTVRPFSNHVLVYTKQPTTKNTKAGDVVLYENEVWINDGHIVASIPSKNYVDEKVEEALKENTMENYIVINGKKAELTEEQLKQLGIKTEKKRNNPFNNELEEVNGSFYYITSDGVILNNDDDYNADMITVANSFNDGIFAEQLYLHELLNRKLLKYAYDHYAEDCDWDDKNEHYYIYFNNTRGYYDIATNQYYRSQSIYFSKAEIARQAIEDIIKPFIKKHPKFVW